MSDNKSQSRRTGAGFSIPAAADELNMPYRTLLSAVERGEVRVIEFAGLRRVPAAEVTRLKSLFNETDTQAA